MRLLVVHADGVVAERTEDAPSIDPRPVGVSTVRMLTEALTYPLIMTFDGLNVTQMSAWLHAQGIKPMRLVPTGHLEPNKRLEDTLSLVGALQGTVGTFLGVYAYDCRFMAGHGYPALQYHEPTPDRSGWGLDTGTTWGKLVPSEVDE